MRMVLSLAGSAALLLAGCQSPSLPPVTRSTPPLTAAAVLASARPEDWRRPDPQYLLCMDFGKGRVVIELLPLLAPRHVANVQALVREGYFDGLAIVRVQDNYVVQWGDPNAEKPEAARPIRTAQRHLPAELEFQLPSSTPFHPLPDGDIYAPQAGFLDGMPIAEIKKRGRWRADKSADHYIQSGPALLLQQSVPVSYSRLGQRLSTSLFEMFTASSTLSQKH